MVGGWVGTYYVFIYYIYYILKLNYFLIKFFWLPNFLSNVISKKKTILWLVKKTTSQVGHVQINLSNMIKLVVKLTKCENDWFFV
jgi:hypothetical protein